MSVAVTRLRTQDKARLEDFLNDKLQTPADLGNLDNLLESVKQQQQLLKQQLQEATEAHEKAAKASSEHEASIRKQADSFNRQQSEIDRRLMIVTQSETSDDAVKRFEASMEGLRRLDIAAGYMELLKEVDDARTKARKNLTTNPRSALPPYTLLHDLVAGLRNAQPAAEGAAPHLIDHVAKQTSLLWQDLHKNFANALEKTLEAMNWPSDNLKITGDLISTWTDQVETLLDLQEPELKLRHVDLANGPNANDPPALLPLEVIVHPLELRFRYHFLGDKPTNRLDKPEYFLNHIIDLLNTYATFFSEYLQPLLDVRSRKADLDLDLPYCDATCAFITALLPMVRHKISLLLPQISSHPQLLSHFIHELMSFDTELRDEWGYTAGSTMDTWKGLTWEVLVKQDWFGRWLRVEKDFALSRYQDIIEASDSGVIDHDGAEPGTTKPTKGAVRVNDLLETITERYKPLPSFSQKLRFLIDIQIAIFDQFHTRLRYSLEAFLARTSLVGRAVQTTNEDQTEVTGVNGLDRLCRVFGSAGYLEEKMRDWSDDIFFVELWDELQDRARQNSGTGRPVAGSMTISEVASRTSAAVADENEDGGALFDETAAAYRRLRLQAEEIIVETLSSSARASLRPYSKVSTWSSLSASLEPSALSPTAELDATLQILSSHLGFLASVLAPAPLRRITRQLCLSIQTYIWDRIIMAHNFSLTGAAQLTRDLEAICSVVNRAINAPGQAERGLRKIGEALVLLSLPIQAPENEAENGNGEVDNDEEEEKVWTLWVVEKMVFKNNESARGVLSQIGLEVIRESEARGVLERRVEVGTTAPSLYR